MNTLPIQRQDSVPAPATILEAFEVFADQAVGIDAQLVKFVRGTWSTGADSEVIKPEARFLAVIPGLRHGHVKWQDGKPVERRMMLVQDHPLPPGRVELGDLDDKTWATDKEGRRIDPWAFCFELPLLDLETNGQRLWSIGSYGGRQCIGRLARTYAQHQRKNPGQLPIITLGCESYKHADYGIVQNPTVRVVEWHADPEWSPPKPAAAVAAHRDLNDEIPF